jgi:hypothetical protein
MFHSQSCALELCRPGTGYLECGEFDSGRCYRQRHPTTVSGRRQRLFPIALKSDPGGFGIAARRNLHLDPAAVDFLREL